jgi:hypothetical protein
MDPRPAECLFNMEGEDSQVNFSDLNIDEFLDVYSIGKITRDLDALVSKRNTELKLLDINCQTQFDARNCEQACADATVLFSPKQLRICILLASAALLVQNKTCSVASDPTTKLTMDQWHIPQLTTYNATPVLAQVTQCISDSCGNSVLGDCSDQARSLGSVKITANNLKIIYSGLVGYCNGFKYDISSDIAGPGVSTSNPTAAGAQMMTFLKSRSLFHISFN